MTFIHDITTESHFSKQQKNLTQHTTSNHNLPYVNVTVFDITYILFKAWIQGIQQYHKKNQEYQVTHKKKSYMCLVLYEFFC